MWKVLILPALFLALAAATLAPPTPRLHSQEPRPWSEALEHQLSLPEVQNSRYVVVIFLGVGDRLAEANQIRQYFADAYGQKYGPDVTVLALPTYAGEGGVLPQGASDVLGPSVVRHVIGGYPAHAADALRRVLESDHAIVGIACHSGAGYVCNDERADIISVLKQYPDQVVAKLAFVNTDLRGLTKEDYDQAGFAAERVQYDGVTWLTTGGRRFIPFGEYLGPPATLLGNIAKIGTLGYGIGAALATDHGLMNAEKVNALDAGLDLGNRVSNARQNDRARRGVAEVTAPDTEHRPEGAATPAPPLSCPPFCPPPPPPPSPTPTPGGIDLSTLELRYLTDHAEPPAHVFGAALKGQHAPPGEGIDLKRATELSWTSLFVWLSFPESTFWVNLNPEEPDRIIDPRLGRTDVGRILLEADLQMKKDVARLTHPDSPLGKAFWDELSALTDPRSGGEQETSIAVNYRVWIVPGEVTVFADDSEIYVLDAQLDVKLEAEHLQALSGDDPPGSSQNPADTSEALGYAEDVFKRMILPRLRDEVNTASQYRELRQIFYSRVVAEWYKSHHDVDDLAFGALVGQEEIEPLQSQEPWSPEEIFQRYLQSLSEGEYSITRETEERRGMHIVRTTQTFFNGGVDLARVPMARVSYGELLAQQPNVSDHLLDALVGPGYRGDGEEWMGGLLVVDTSRLQGLPIRGGAELSAARSPDDNSRIGEALEPEKTRSSNAEKGWRSPPFVVAAIVVGSVVTAAAALTAGLLWLRARSVRPY